MPNESKTTRYRVRRGWGGKCILQKLYNTPSFIGGHVDASIRDIHWDDVDYKHAPTELTDAKI